LFGYSPTANRQHANGVTAAQKTFFSTERASTSNVLISPENHFCKAAHCLNNRHVLV